MCSINAFYKIRKSFDLANKSFKMFINDEEAINRMVYDLQQTVEKTLKAYLEWNVYYRLYILGSAKRGVNS